MERLFVSRVYQDWGEASIDDGGLLGDPVVSVHANDSNSTKEA